MLKSFFYSTLLVGCLSTAHAQSAPHLEYRFVKTWTELDGLDLINNLKAFGYIVPQGAGVEDVTKSLSFNEKNSILLQSKTTEKDKFCKNISTIITSTQDSTKKIVSQLDVTDDLSQQVNQENCSYSQLTHQKINYTLITSPERLSMEYDDEQISPTNVIPVDMKKILIRIPTQATKQGNNNSIFHLNYFVYIELKN